MLIAQILLYLTSSLAQSLPDLTVPPDWTKCEKDIECAIAGDACRSCRSLYVINRQYLKQFKDMDLAERKKKNILIACEACSLQDVKVFCRKNRCGHE